MAAITPPEPPLMTGDASRDIQALFEYLKRLVEYLYTIEVA